MGTSIWAIIEIDDNTPPDKSPFTYYCSAWDLTHDIGLSDAKDYLWYAALAGVRNDTGRDPLFAPRGLPDNAHDVTRAAIDVDDLGVSWLTLGEIEAAMLHMGLNRNQLSPNAGCVLDVMATIERRFGKDRVRLVFGFS